MRIARIAGMAALGLAVAIALSCKTYAPPDTRDFSVIPATGHQGTLVRLRLVVTDTDNVKLTVWVTARKYLDSTDFRRIDCPAVADSANVFAGTWTADTTGLNHPDIIELDSHVSNGHGEYAQMVSAFTFMY